MIPPRPIPPHRAPFPGSPQVELIREVAALGARVDVLTSSVEARFTKLEASGRTETIKVIASAVVSCVLAVVGARAIAPSAPPPAPTARSAFDRALDSCRALPGEAERVDCVLRVTAQSTSVPVAGRQ